MERAPKSYRKGDKALNPELAAQVATVRGAIEEAAERVAMPSRFEAFPHENRPAMVIHDRETGRETTVPLYAYGPVREALNDLFGDRKDPFP